jgi:LmbE family N-acetylglucosaminyl deacetylase
MISPLSHTTPTPVRHGSEVVVAPHVESGQSNLPPIVWTFWRRWVRKLRMIFGRRQSAVRDGWAAAEGAVLFVAPHPDDEVIGCGGTMLRHADAGDAVTIVYLTRGERSRGYPWLSAAERKTKRVAEAKASCSVLGVKDAVFLDGIDGRCGEPEVAEALTAQLSAVINSRNPKIIYVPHADDNHPDHVAAYQVVSQIVRNTDWRPKIYQYELWSPLDADFAVDVTDQMKRKVKAVKRHHLALDAFNYIPTMMGLAAYRSGTLLQRKGYAEAFKRTPRS